jgi:hypothetical protein
MTRMDEADAERMENAAHEARQARQFAAVLWFVRWVVVLILMLVALGRPMPQAAVLLLMALVAKP